MERTLLGTRTTGSMIHHRVSVFPFVLREAEIHELQFGNREIIKKQLYTEPVA
jgi:hypothetical protein